MHIESLENRLLLTGLDTVTFDAASGELAVLTAGVGTALLSASGGNVSFKGTGALENVMVGGAPIAAATVRKINLSTPGAGVHLSGVTANRTTFPLLETVVINGGSGRDIISTALVADGIPTEVYGNAGNDDIRGSEGFDILVGGDGSDKVNGLGGMDYIYGGDPGNPGTTSDELFGGYGDDTIVAGTAADTIEGGHGADIIETGGGGGSTDGGPGRDLIDGVFDDVVPAGISVRTMSSDSAEPSPVTSETFASDSYRVRLSSAPAATVYVQARSLDPDEVLVRVGANNYDRTLLVFTPTNWSSYQTVSLVGVNDAIEDGDQVFTMYHKAVLSDDAEYSGLEGPLVFGVNEDDDARIHVTPTHLVTGEDGTSADFNVVLRSAPTAPVTVPITSLNPAEGTVSVGALVFNAGNWDTPQSVTVTGKDDDFFDPDFEYIISVGPAVSADATFSGFDPRDVNVVNREDSLPGFEIGPFIDPYSVAHSTSEDASQYALAVRLTSQPTDNVTLPLSSSNTDEGVISTSSLVFTNYNWDEWQYAVVTGVDDDVVDGDIEYSIVFADSTSSDEQYDGVALKDIEIVNIDLDKASIDVYPSEILYTSEAEESDDFWVVLTSRPGGNVSIPVASLDTTEGTTSVSSLVFTPENWNVPQSVTVTGVYDMESDGDVSYYVELGQASSSDDNYDGWDPVDVFVTNVDFAVNTLPVAVDDSDSTDEDVPVDIDVLANDSDADFDSLVVYSIGIAMFGDVVNNGTDITYTPDENFFGEDHFTYTVSDGAGGFRTAQVHVTVSEADDLPSAANDSAITGEETPVVIDVLSNDDAGDEQPVVVASVSSASSGSVAFTAAEVVYTPDPSFTGSDSFTYGISDPDGNLAYATVSVSVVAIPHVVVSDDVSTNESGSVTFTVSLSGPSSDTVSVAYSTPVFDEVVAGRATAYVDFEPTAGVLTFSPGITQQTVTVNILTDVLDEADEEFELYLYTPPSQPMNAVLDDMVGTGTITDDDDPPEVSIASVSQNPSVGESVGSAVLTFQLSAPSGRTVVAYFDTSEDLAGSYPATPNEDFPQASGTPVSFSPGETTATANVTITTDDIDEPNETFVVTLTNADYADVDSGATLSTITILDDDDPPTVSISDAEGTEGGYATFTVSLSAVSGFDVIVPYGWTNGSATHGEDYDVTESQVTIFAGDTTETFTIALSADGVDEDDETFQIDLSTPSHATIGDGQGTATIHDNDAEPTISVSDDANNEGETLAFVVTLSHPSERGVTVQYGTANNTAGSSDYVADSNTLSFGPGQTATTVYITTNDDYRDEYEESFYLNLTSPTNSTIADGQGEGTLYDTDEAEISMVSEAWGDEDVGSLTFAVSLSMPSDYTITVQYSTNDGWAEDGYDYTGYTGTTNVLTFSPGQTEIAIAVAIIDDGDYEDPYDEDFYLDLSNAVNASIYSGSATGWIYDNDSEPLTLNLPAQTPPSGVSAVQTSQLDPLIDEAAARWLAAGADADDLADVLDDADWQVVDLPRSLLALTAENRVYIDLNAAGHGWFLDSTPTGDSEFTDVVATTELTAEGTSVALGAADLLTAITHEIGHLLGLPHLDGSGDEHNVMHPEVGLGTRRNPADGQGEVEALRVDVSAAASLTRHGGALGETELASLAAAATRYWEAEGASPAALASLADMEFRLANLPGNYLGLRSGNVILVDRDAAGFGWLSGDGALDPLAAVTHEVGHALGLTHDDHHRAMAPRLAPGENLFARLSSVASSSGGALGSDIFSTFDLTGSFLEPPRIGGRFASAEPRARFALVDEYFDAKSLESGLGKWQWEDVSHQDGLFHRDSHASGEFAAEVDRLMAEDGLLDDEALLESI